MNNKKNLILGIASVAAIYGLYYMFSQNAPQAVAEQAPVVQEQVQQPEPVAQTETPAPPVEESAPAQPSLGASSSGLGR